ncbi:Serine incorporator 5 [Sparganum proliferum]
MPLSCISLSKESTSTRFFYCLILFIVSLLAVIFHSSGESGSDLLRFMSRNMQKVCLRTRSEESCIRLVGYVAVYRFCIPLAIFHFLLMLLTINVSDSQSVRGKIHNGFWFWKILLLSGLWVSSVFLPSLSTAVYVLMMIGVAGGIAVIYIQHVFLIDFAYELNGRWYARSKTNPKFLALVYVGSALLYFASFASYALLLGLWGIITNCVLNSMIVYVNACVTGAILLFSVASPRIRNQHLWLPGAITAAFAAYLTWSAVLSQPKTIVRGVSVEWQAMQFFRMSSPLNATASLQLSLNRTGRLMRNRCFPQARFTTVTWHPLSDIIAIGGLVMVIVGTVFSGLRLSAQAKRIGIKTRRNRFKEILREVHGPKCAAGLSSPAPACNCLTMERKSKQRIRALSMLMDVLNEKADEHHPGRASLLGDQSQLKSVVKRKGTLPVVASDPALAASAAASKRLTLQEVPKSVYRNPPAAPILCPPAAGVEGGTANVPPRVSGDGNRVSSPPPLPSARSDGIELMMAAVKRRNRTISESGAQRPASCVETTSPAVGGSLSSFSSLEDVRLAKARYVTAYLSKDEGRHLLHRNAELATSVVSFADVVADTRAPRDQFTIYNEAILAVYSYSWFHFTFCLSCLYMMAQLTNWYNPELSNIHTVLESWANMWMKLLSAWLALLLYAWTIFCMRFCVGRSLIEIPLAPTVHWTDTERDDNGNNRPQAV